MLEIDILRNLFQIYLGVLRSDFGGFRCPKDAQTPCWPRLCWVLPSGGGGGNFFEGSIQLVGIGSLENSVERLKIVDYAIEPTLFPGTFSRPVIGEK